MNNFLAFDLGASSGVAVLGKLEEKKLHIKEIHRFENNPVKMSNHLYWDFLRIIYEIKKGMHICFNECKNGIDSIGIDTWGVDFGLIDQRGSLLSNPYHYRDSRIDNIIMESADIVDKRELFYRTGNQPAQYNTVYQLISMKKCEDKILDICDKLLMFPDLINYVLTGEICSEYTEATTTQLYNFNIKNWDDEVLSKIRLPLRIFPEVVMPGTLIGNLREEICHELSISKVPVVSVASHDTASAEAAVPYDGEDCVFISSGTWSLLGTQTEYPIVNDRVYEYSFTNEGSASGKNLLLKNIMGLWLMQECRREWNSSGLNLDFDIITELSKYSPPFRSLVDPDCIKFFHPGNMIKKIQDFCKETNQDVPKTAGEIARCIEESLAFKYRWSIEKLEEITEKKIKAIHIVGGGAKDSLLCQFTANATGKKVIAGPVEASAIGNLLLQAKAIGAIGSLSEGKKIIKNSFDIKEFMPEDIEIWENNYMNFLKINNK